MKINLNHNIFSSGYFTVKTFSKFSQDNVISGTVISLQLPHNKDKLNKVVIGYRIIDADLSFFTIFHIFRFKIKVKFY